MIILYLDNKSKDKIGIDVYALFMREAMETMDSETFQLYLKSNKNK